MSRARQVQASPPSNIIGSGPTAEDAFDAFVTLVAFCVDHRAVETLYDQRSDHLPLDAKSPDAYKRWHRAARSAGIPGTRGKLLLATAEARGTPLRRQRLAVLPTPPVNSQDGALDAALGIRAVRRSK
ncbi:MAG TPA: hypothetical protein VN894_12515 [Polyangiaceae bacterium]|nr:hypothetical protein [Polyangiaceae bacterium]